MSSVFETRPADAVPRVLLAYGVVGGVAALLILMSGFLLVADLRTQADSLVSAADTAASGVEAVADTLDAADGTTVELGASMTRTTAALAAAAATLDSTAQALRTSAAAAGGVTLLGAQPLAALAGSLQDTATQVQGIRSDLDGIDASLVAAQPGVDALPAQLADLSARLRLLGSGMHAAATEVRDGLTGLLVWLVLGLTIAVGLPAAAAAAGGLWLRGQLWTPPGRLS